MKNQQGLHGAKRLFLMQLRVGVSASLVIWAILGLGSARSMLLGAVVCLVPHALYESYFGTNGHGFHNRF